MRGTRIELREKDEEIIPAQKTTRFCHLNLTFRRKCKKRRGLSFGVSLGVSLKRIKNRLVKNDQKWFKKGPSGVKRGQVGS